jgi:hypothetical protein
VLQAALTLDHPHGNRLTACRLFTVRSVIPLQLRAAPFDQRRRALWREERRGAVELLASVANWDAVLLRRAALETAREWTNRAARDLLLDAAQACG